MGGVAGAIGGVIVAVPGFSPLWLVAGFVLVFGLSELLRRL